MAISRRQFVRASAAGLFAPAALSTADEGLRVQPDRELRGKTICGYQGWFNTPGDGMGLGFRHYQANGLFETGHCTIDLWPEVGELDPAGRYDTAFRHRDGSTAQVFSSADAGTVDTHFRWMAEYGIDGAALQRFGVSLRGEKLKRMRDRVLANARAAAARHGRLWMNMYDLSGMRAGEPQELIAEDWRRLVDDERIAEDRTYLTHQGRPTVALWGVGFNDDRAYTLQDCAQLIERVRMGGRFSVMLGVPYYWREQARDALGDPALHDVLRSADILSPWAVGRLNRPDQALQRGESHLRPDIEWCERAGLHYLPTVFPGFSWHNLDKSRGRDSALDVIPRRGGRFLWSQAEAARRAGASSLYVAMFDEMDEATCIFKCSQDPPVGESPFLTYQDVLADHYLWLTGRIARRLRRGAGPAIQDMPTRRG